MKVLFGSQMTYVMDNVEMSQYESSSMYDLLQLLERSEDEEYVISPFSNMTSGCEYHEPSDFNLDVIESADTKMSCFHLNCRGLSTNWENCNHLINTLHGQNFAFDIIGISECYKHEQDARIKLNGYHEFLSRNRVDDHRGGVGLFIKETVQYKIRNDLSVFIPNIFESLFIEFDCG